MQFDAGKLNPPNSSQLYAPFFDSFDFLKVTFSFTFFYVNDALQQRHLKSQKEKWKSNRGKINSGEGGGEGRYVESRV